MSGAKPIYVPHEWDTLVRGKSGVCHARSEGADHRADGGELYTNEGQKRKAEASDSSAASMRKRKKGFDPPASGKKAACNDREPSPSSTNESDCQAADFSELQDAHAYRNDTDIKSTQDVCHNILQALNRTPRTNACLQGSQELNLDHVLSRVPYKQILQDLFCGVTAGEMSSMEIPIVSRIYEEQYMRESYQSSERQCVMGGECECNYIDKSNPFVGVEFLLPNEVRPDEVQMCVLCHRRFVQSMFHDVVYSGKQFRGVIQRYGNICGQPGEYAKEVALICPPNGPTQCMPLPSISHQRNKYSISTVGGVRHVVQHKMSPEDFCHPPRGAH